MAEERFDENPADLDNQTELIHHRQIDGARGTFEAMVRLTNNQIDAIKRNNEKKEKDRRFEEEIKRQQRYEAIQNMAQIVSRKKTELDMRWSEYQSMEECEELARGLEEHKNLFEDLVRRKQSIIDSLQGHIRFKDEEYIREMESMKIDIDSIVSNMRKQFSDLRNLVASELKVVEEDLNRQRSEMIKGMQGEITEKFERHRAAEEEAANTRMKDEADNAQMLELLRIDNDKAFMRLKIISEIEIQNCEKCHEDMKALYQLNSEKLAYNYKVLSDKNDENSKLQAQLKAKDTDYRDQYKRKNDEYKRKHEELNQLNKKLTKQYISISKQYKDLHKKFKHFVQADTARYQEIHKMNLDEIAKMKERIKNCDRIIHQHQLGVVWEPFTEEDLEVEEIVSQGEPEPFEEEEKSPEEQPEEKDEGGLIPEQDMHAILNLVLYELDFLLDDKVSTELEKEEPKEQLLIKLNVLRKVLAIKDESEMTRLLIDIYQGARKKEDLDQRQDPSRFSRSEHGETSRDEWRRNIDVDNYNARDFDEDEQPMGDDDQNVTIDLTQMERRRYGPHSEVEDQDIETIEQKYDPNLLIQILTKFIEEKKNHVVLNSADHHTKKLIQKREKEKNLQEQRKDRAKMSKALPNERLKMWRVLDKISTQYYRLLLDRQKDIEETTLLHTQNDELRNLLNQYLKVNHNLLVPPIDMLNVNFLE